MCREVILGRKYQKFEIVAKGCISMSLKAHFVLEDVKALHSLSFYCNINCGVKLKPFLVCCFLYRVYKLTLRVFETTLKVTVNLHVSKIEVFQSCLSYLHHKIVHKRGRPNALHFKHALVMCPQLLYLFYLLQILWFSVLSLFAPKCKCFGLLSFPYILAKL